MASKLVGCLLQRPGAMVVRKWLCGKDGRTASSACLKWLSCSTASRVGRVAMNTRTQRPTTMLWFTLGLFGFFEKKKEDSELEILVKRGILAVQQGEPEKAERLFHVGLKMAQELQDDSAVTFIYDMMANLALQQNQLDKAETLFKTILSRLLNAGTAENDNALVEISLKLASIYSMMGDNNKANEGYKFCIDTQEKKLQDMTEMDEDTLLLWAMSVDWYARFLVHQGAYEYAEKYFRKALDVCKTVNGVDHPQTAVLLNDLATVYSVMKRHDEAEDHLKEAISIGKRLGLDELGSFYVNRGLILIRKGMTKEALESCKQGMRLGKSQNDEEVKQEAQKCIDDVQKVLKEMKK